MAYAGVAANDIQSIILIGGSAHLGGLQQKMLDQIKIKVRMGQNPPTLNIMNGGINRMEYIEIFSLLAEAAERIGEGETCVELNKYEDGGLKFDGPVRSDAASPADPEPPVKRKEPKKQRGWIQGLKKRIDSIMSEDDEDEEQ